MTISLGDQLVNDYMRWLRERITVEDVDGVCEITTPFLDRHNDHLQICVRLLGDDRLALGDDGYVIRDLRMSGCDIDTPRRRVLLQTILNGFGVRLQGDSLHVESTRQEFAHKKHSLLQAMIAVNDLFVTARPQVAQLFRDDVERFLALNQVRFVPTVKFVGKSGFDHLFDFVIPASSRYPERALRAINNPDRQQAILLVFAKTDTREVRPAEARVVAVLNDVEGRVPEDVVEAFGRYEVETVRWTERDQHLPQLVQ